MKEYVAVIAAVVAGVFTIVSAITMWKLTHRTSEIAREQATADAKFNEKKALYVRTHELYESAIKCTKNYESNNLSEAFSKLTAEINLIASSDVAKQYFYVADLFQDWMPLYFKAFPAPQKIGDQTYITIQSPDPTLKYKQPEKEAYEKFYSSYEELIKLMRVELAAA
ncbi:TPA: hypothetical protein ACMD0U_003515 [Vibrio parahaemolyticus]|uniref:hypothetical protein n=1 Tax=Vibrio sp. SALL6 TaxID=1904359 RepID=UPI0009852466|nr:hypothetical protein [Vibrio sp. SALL6]EHV5548609.1 hypothetical protein [Vibrio parahaemolyticus]OOH98690.1 hypothetical protein BIW15_23280 [Vibrio sp. SALL6]